MRHKKLATNKVTHSGLLALKNGIVWVGCPDADCKKEIAIKKCDKHEYETQKALNKEFPKLVPDVYNGVQCTDGFFMYSEYVKGGSLKTYKTHPKLGEYVYKVLLALKVVHLKHPSFRHNDLHVDNVLMRGDQPLIYDFEFANWRGNPMFDSLFKKDYGIYSGNNVMYDFHFFINSIVSEFPGKFRALALSVFPPEYIVKDSPVVREWRLRSDANHKNLPTMDQVLRVFSSVHKKNNMRPKVLTFSNTTTKKTTVTRSPPRKTTTTTKATARNREKIRNLKATILRNNPNMNSVQAELKAIRNYEILKTAGLVTSSPSPTKRKAGTAPAARRPIVRKSPTPALPRPSLTFTSTPRRRPRIGSKLCTSYKKQELMVLVKRLGHRVDSKMTLASMCKLLGVKNQKPVNYKRPVGTPILDVKKKTYEDHLRKNLYKLAKNAGVKVLSKDKKGDIITKIRSKLNKNITDVLKGMNMSKVTARQLSEKLAKNYGWKNNRHIERTRLLKIYGERI
jgi:hypothetical protein